MTRTLRLPLGHRSRARRITIVGALLAMLASMSVVFAQSASAATWESTYNEVRIHHCTLRMGPVEDPYGDEDNFSVIGGAQIVNCSRVSNFKVYVQEQYSDDGIYWYNIAREGISPYYRGFTGMTRHNITTTGRSCGYEYWRTAADAYIVNSGYASYTGWWHSTPRLADAERC